MLHYKSMKQMLDDEKANLCVWSSVSKCYQNLKQIQINVAILSEYGIPLCFLFHHINVYKQLILECILPRATIQIATNLVYIIIL